MNVGYQIYRALLATAGSAFLLQFAVACAVMPHREATRVVQHHLDEIAWRYSDVVRWPGTSKFVAVVFDPSGANDVCGRKLSVDSVEKIKTTEVLFGQACGRLVAVLGQRMRADGEMEAQAIAAHESFHEAIQYNGLKPRLDSVEFPGRIGKEQHENLSQFMVWLVNTLRAGRFGAAQCRSFEAHVNRLDEPVRKYFLYKSYWEWPAEFYMRSSTLRGLTFGEYVRFRQGLSLDGEANMLYVAGVAAFENVETFTSREAWQRQYLDGDSPVNILLSANGCRPVQSPSLQVKMSLDEIFN